MLAIPLAISNDAPGQARADLTAWLERDSTAATLLDDARLLISELVTNSILDAYITHDQPLRLPTSVRATALRLELHDTGTNGTVARRTPDKTHGAGGFGLDLVAQLSSASGVERDAHGTTVWLELDLGSDLGYVGACRSLTVRELHHGMVRLERRSAMALA